MILTCPECAARYQTDAAMIGAEGRKVKCSNCGHAWVEMAPVEADGTTPVYATPDAEAIEPLARKSVQMSTGLGWAIFLVLVGGAVTIGYVSRDAIIEAVPKTEQLYALVGLSPTQSGLEILSPYFERGENDGERTLTVHAELVNVTTREVTVPPIQVTLKNADNEPVFTWTKQPDVVKLGPGATTSIMTTIANPPLEAIDLEIEIVTRRK